MTEEHAGVRVVIRNPFDVAAIYFFRREYPLRNSRPGQTYCIKKYAWTIFMLQLNGAKFARWLYWKKQPLDENTREGRVVVPRTI